MNEPKRGMIVRGPNGQLGTVDDLIYENPGAQPRLIVRRDDGAGMVLQSGTYYVQGGMVHVGIGGAARDASQDSLTTTTDIYRTQQLNVAERNETLEVRPGQSLVVPVIREQVVVTRREVAGGGVRIHKRVEEREEVVEQPTFREEVSVERVALGQPIDAEVGSRQEGDTLIIPVLEEMLVVEKRLVLKEEIRITKRRVQETEQARIVLREEHVDIENIDGTQAVA